MWQLCCDDADIVQYLLERGAEIDAKDKKCRTALFHASHGGREDVVKFLLENSADHTITDNEGNTCLHVASTGGDLDCVRVLAEYNIPVNSKNLKNETPLHFAAYGGSINIVDYLLVFGVDHQGLEPVDGDSIRRLAVEVDNNKKLENRLSKTNYDKKMSNLRSKILTWRFTVKALMRPSHKRQK
jgi:ankyrin repeat protein